MFLIFHRVIYLETGFKVVSLSSGIQIIMENYVKWTRFNKRKWKPTKNKK